VQHEIAGRDNRCYVCDSPLVPPVAAMSSAGRGETTHDAHRLIRELIEVGTRVPGDTETASRFLTKGRKRTVQIGEDLNRLGGMTLMLEAHGQVQNHLGHIPARELEVAWDGIGDWLG
jgi:hypothetical protein